MAESKTATKKSLDETKTKKPANVAKKPADAAKTKKSVAPANKPAVVTKAEKSVDKKAEKTVVENNITTQPVKEKPRYTKGEEIFNAVTHIVGGGFGIIFLVLGVVFAHLYSTNMGVLSMWIYGVCTIITYTMSSIYHFLNPNTAKKVFRIFDHCSIFLLIAGTYTPFCLVTLQPEPLWAWLIFGFVWGISILGITFTAIDMKKWKKINFVLYILLGWCIVIAIVPLMTHLAWAGFWWLLAGGITYTVGAVFYAFGKKAKYIHSVWHLFVLGGSICHFISILFYVIL